LNFTYAFKCYHQKCKLASLYLAHPVRILVCVMKLKLVFDST